ncbi:hypothetical protein [Bacillus cereus]|nr:hypothetical protein [Bacillus cereus]PFR46726.1 hypothetical protein COK35_23945 [Bacillus cereus]
MKKIVASLVIAGTLALSVLSVGSVSTKDNKPAEKVKEVQIMKMDPGTLG